MQTIKSGCLFIFLLLFFSFFSYSASYTINSVPNPYQQHHITYVVDPENILSAHDKTIINQRLYLLETKTTAEIAVVALPSIDYQEPRQFANQLFNHWQIGKQDKDNGLLILLILDQREVIFETGYGLEGILTDSMSYRLMDDYMLGLLKQNQYSQGMVQGVNAVADFLEEQFSDDEFHPVSVNPLTTFNFSLIVVIIASLITLVNCFGDRLFPNPNPAEYVYRSPRDKIVLLCIALSLISFLSALILVLINKGYSDNLFLFGFGGFSLTGCIIYFITKGYKTDKKNPICPKCRHRTINELLVNTKQYLSDNEHYEKKIKAVTYRFFRCSRPKCYHFIKIQKINKGWSTCAVCQTVSNKLIDSTILKAATYQDTGFKKEYYQCVKCELEETRELVIPKKRRPYGGSGRAGGFGGGMSGGGSRGGGYSGGGGARGRF